jgi:hypothetical protein
VVFGPSLRVVVRREFEVREARRAVRAADADGDERDRLATRHRLVGALLLAWMLPGSDSTRTAERVSEWARAEALDAAALDRLVGALEMRP